MKNFAYFCLGIGALCIGASLLIFSLKYQPPKPSALDEMQDAMTRRFSDAMEQGIDKKE